MIRDIRIGNRTDALEFGIFYGKQSNKSWIRSLTVQSCVFLDATFTV
jgi:hypothetical protein